MGWDELLGITPGMFIALINRRSYCHATWVATYANLKRGKGDPTITPEQLLERRPTKKSGSVFSDFQKAFSET